MSATLPLVILPEVTEAWDDEELIVPVRHEPVPLPRFASAVILACVPMVAIWAALS